MGKKDEQRKHSRFQLSRIITVARGEETVLGSLVDLSLDGVCFTSSIDFAVDSTVSLICMAGEDKEGEKLDAKVLRCLPVGHSSYKVAAIFLNPNVPYLKDIMASSQAG